MAQRGAFVQASARVPWLDPLDAYLRLRAAGLRPTLLAGAGAHPEARWSFVAFDPMVEVRIEGDAFEERWADGAIEAGTADPRAYLAALAERVRAAGTAPVPPHSAFSAESAFRPAGAAETPMAPNPPNVPFSGGWVGLLSFGLARSLEPALAGMPSEGPDAILRLARSALAFDHGTRTAHAFAADLDGDLAAARDRLTAALAALETPVRLEEAPRVMGPWQASLAQADFEAAVRRLQALVHGGDHFQANLATRFSAPFAGDPAALFSLLSARNPSPFMALWESDGLAIASASPEQLFAVEGGRIRSRPIAGTRKRGATAEEDARMEAELLSDPKEQAEHTMLVDLVRNDLARVSLPGTVAVAERGSVERYSHVMHLVSRVEGALRPGTGFCDWLAALFPGGTVTGAPKVRAVQRILESEPVPRGPYTGSIGYLGWSRNAQWNILIRSVVVQGGTAHVHAGSGIVAGSDPAREWAEAGRKARALLDAAEGGPPRALRAPPAPPASSCAAPPGRLGEVTRHGSWAPPCAVARHAGARVLLIDNYDSFVHNLADGLAALGASCRVVRNDADWPSALRAHAATHVVLSPGPGWPDEAGCTLEVARALHGRMPLLGVCLGHQAIGQAHGARVRIHPAGPVHGRADLVHHTGEGLFAGLPSPLQAGRYHSLALEGAPGPDWAVDARLADGTVMALRHRRAPTFGLQFHPESLCTPLGLELLDRFLAMPASGAAAQGILVTR